MKNRRILLAEDNAYDIELSLSALARHRLVNDVTVVRDGAVVSPTVPRETRC